MPYEAACMMQTTTCISFQMVKVMKSVMCRELCEHKYLLTDNHNTRFTSDTSVT